MFNIKKAVSRLPFAPKLDDIQITDIKRGLGVFKPKADQPVTFAALKEALKKAGYKLASAELTALGKLAKDDAGWWLEVEESKQRFALAGDVLKQLDAESTPGSRFTMAGDWQTVEQGKAKREVLTLRTVTRMTARANLADRLVVVSARKWSAIEPAPEANVTHDQASILLAPIRTTSPGLTVYKGGGVTLRYSHTSQHLGDLDVTRQGVKVAVSYTPTSTLQLEAEVPYQHTSFRQGAREGSGHGFGNLTLWGKYRFFRELETWGDRQAAFRFGVEVPTGKKASPQQAVLEAPAFVRQQLSPIDNGWAAHFDTSFSQAKKRLLYGANLEATLRGERDGYRLGHEVRLNTDLEYVLLPFTYRRPTKELFLLFETTYRHRRHGRVNGQPVQGSGSDEFFLAPGLQYIATQRLILEASYQIPVVRNTGALVLRTDANFLFGVKVLY